AECSKKSGCERINVYLPETGGLALQCALLPYSCNTAEGLSVLSGYVSASFQMEVALPSEADLESNHMKSHVGGVDACEGHMRAMLFLSARGPSPQHYAMELTASSCVSYNPSAEESASSSNGESGTEYSSNEEYGESGTEYSSNEEYGESGTEYSSNEESNKAASATCELPFVVYGREFESCEWSSNASADLRSNVEQQRHWTCATEGLDLQQAFLHDAQINGSCEMQGEGMYVEGADLTRGWYAFEFCGFDLDATAYSLRAWDKSAENAGWYGGEAILATHGNLWSNVVTVPSGSEGYCKLSNGNVVQNVGPASHCERGRHAITSAADCQLAASLLNAAYHSEASIESAPAGCVLYGGALFDGPGVYFNTHAVGGMGEQFSKLCYETGASKWYQAVAEPWLCTVDAHCRYEGCFEPSWDIPAKCDVSTGRCFHSEVSDGCSPTAGLDDSDSESDSGSDSDSDPEYAAAECVNSTSWNYCPASGSACLMDCAAPASCEDLAAMHNGGDATRTAYAGCLADCMDAKVQVHGEFDVPPYERNLCAGATFPAASQPPSA
ncbi:hypothetical protein CYMTET_34658, partial [Cymbomonas tetramitiformis]